MRENKHRVLFIALSRNAIPVNSCARCRSTEMDCWTFAFCWGCEACSAGRSSPKQPSVKQQLGEPDPNLLPQLLVQTAQMRKKFNCIQISNGMSGERSCFANVKYIVMHFKLDLYCLPNCNFFHLLFK